MRIVAVIALLTACDKPDPERPRDRDTDTRAEDTDTGPKEPSGPPARLSGAYSLADADARIDASAGIDVFGAQLTAVGDVDGDGRDDVLLGAPRDTDPTFQGEFHGRTWLVPGGSASGVVTVDATASGSLQGTRSGEAAGTTATPLGDWNGDGFADFAVGAPGGYQDGRVAVVYGPFAGDIRFDSADALLAGPVEARAGTALIGGVDFSGDGRGDLVVASYTSVDDLRADLWIVADAVTGLVDLDEVAAGRVLFPADLEGGILAASAGDTDGDGQASLAVLRRGPRELLRFDPPLLGDLTPDVAAWTLPVPEETGDIAVLAEGGDGDGDGYTELPIGFPNAGVAYLVGEPEDPDADLIAAARATLRQPDAVAVGATLAFVGDLDGDGAEDLAVAATHDDLEAHGSGDSARGVVYLLYGPVGGEIDLADADAIFQGEATADFASQVGRVGDLNGDGYPDLAIGAPGTNPTEGAVGSVYLFLGGTQL